MGWCRNCNGDKKKIDMQSRVATLNWQKMVHRYNVEVLESKVSVRNVGWWNEESTLLSAQCRLHV